MMDPNPLCLSLEDGRGPLADRRPTPRHAPFALTPMEQATTWRTGRRIAIDALILPQGVCPIASLRDDARPKSRDGVAESGREGDARTAPEGGMIDLDLDLDRECRDALMLRIHRIVETLIECADIDPAARLGMMRVIRSDAKLRSISVPAWRDLPATPGGACPLQNGPLQNGPLQKGPLQKVPLQKVPLQKGVAEFFAATDIQPWNLTAHARAGLLRQGWRIGPRS